MCSLNRRQLSSFVHESLLVWSLTNGYSSLCNHLLQQLIPIQASIQQKSPYSLLKKLSCKSVNFCLPSPWRHHCPAARCAQGLANNDSSVKHRRFHAQAPHRMVPALSPRPAESGQFAFCEKTFHFRMGGPPCRAEFSADTSLYFWTNWIKPEVFCLASTEERSRQVDWEQWFRRADTACKVI